MLGDASLLLPSAFWPTSLFDCSSATPQLWLDHRRETDYQRASLIPGKVLGPSLLQWMEKRSWSACLGIYAMLSSLFVIIT
jgi:hypothetical protein